MEGNPVRPASVATNPGPVSRSSPRARPRPRSAAAAGARHPTSSRTWWVPDGATYTREARIVKATV